MSVETYTLSKLVDKYDGGIRIPMIQRDYAQGRASWVNPRERFLKDIRRALMLDGKPLHLDFVYGVQQEEDDSVAFSPLDGQQRLTTLFLLHWYLAARDGCFGIFQKVFRRTVGASKFSYQVRPGGRSFFQALVHYEPPSGGNFPGASPSAWIYEQSWFRTVWERDPSVAGALAMLDAIHKHFNGSSETDYEQLANGNRITFRVLDIEAAGLHDDLYLRMNARGRSLSQFEPFKARYVKHLRQVFPETSALACCSVQFAKYLSNRLDNQWLDFVWRRYGPGGDSEDTNSFDAAFMNLFRAVALVSLPELKEKEAEKNKDVEILRAGKPDYDDFENGGWLTPRFTLHLTHLLEALTGERAECSLKLLGSPWFEDSSLLDRVLRSDAKPSLTDCLQFAACVRFIARHGTMLDENNVGCFRDWMRVVRNLVLNTDLSSISFRRQLAGLDQLVDGSEHILKHLSESTIEIPGYTRDQIAEERLKARLMIADEKGWSPLIHEAEAHPYFCGQIDFLLDFSGAKLPIDDHSKIQRDFRKYLDRAEEMFDTDGLKKRPENDFLWQRALLAVGDYLLNYSGERRSFLNPGLGRDVSWKRFLQDNEHGKRGYLKELWDRVDTESYETSLKSIVSGAASQELWRKTLCSTPEVWAYCKNRLIQFVKKERDSSPPRVLLLSGTIRSTSYEELHSFCFRIKEGLPANKPFTDNERFHPFKYVGRGYVSGSYHPHLKFELGYKGKTHALQLYCHCFKDTGFSIRIPSQGLDQDFSDFLTKQAGFIAENEPLWLGDHLVNRQSSGDPLDGAKFLQTVADALSQDHPSS